MRALERRIRQIEERVTGGEKAPVLLIGRTDEDFESRKREYLEAGGDPNVMFIFVQIVTPPSAT